MPISPRRSTRRAELLLAGALIALTGNALALTTLELQDGASATVRISKKDPTRLTVHGAPILEVIGGAVRSEANPLGTLSVSQSAEQGDAYVMPIEGHPAVASSIFVVTGQGTYTLVLVPEDIPADTVLIRDRRAAAPASRADPGQPYPRERAILALLRDIASDAPSPELTITEMNRPVALWQEARFTLERRYTGHPRWTVDVYLLTNVSQTNLVLDEREFVTPDVIAVGLEQADLAPGQSTRVRVARVNEVRP